MSQIMYKIAFVPFDAYGHVNCCLGLARNFRERGHKCVFIANQNWKNLITKHDFQYYQYIEEHKLGDQFSWNEFMAEQGEKLGHSSFEKIREFNVDTFSAVTNDIKLFNEKLKNLLKEVKPDAIVVDSFVSVPAVITAGVPWVELCSCNPLCYLDDQQLPPGESGYPINDNKNWKAFRDEIISCYSQVWNPYNEWMQSEGAPPLESGAKFLTSSSFMNLYLYPQELSYYETGVEHPKRFFIDHLIREDSETKMFEIPNKLAKRPGKLVYFSMGTLSCSDLKLMRRLITILNKSKHRFIVSKGPLGDQIELGDNMWGQNYLPQLQVLPLVDLVLTHGGNNTVTESVYFGKPMIVLPVFGDQYDNAQRLHEKGLGIRLEPYSCTESQLLDAIEKLVNDSDLTQKCKNISKRIQKSKSRETAVKLIENIITQWKSDQDKLQ